MSDGVRERLIGAWSLVSYSMATEVGEVLYPLGPDATGLIVYTPNGFMSGQIQAAERRPYASKDVHRGAPEEAGAAVNGYLAHSGPFVVDEDEGTVRHRPAVSLFPNWVGTTQKRYVRLDGPELVLSTDPARYRGALRAATLRWKRAGGNAPV